MSSILLVTSSPRGEDSHSTQLAHTLAESLAAARPGAAIAVRDLAREAPPHIDTDFVTGLATPEEDRTPGQSRALAASDAAVDELMAADTIVIAAGLINFGIPSTLKAWLDNVARAGRTFRYTADGPEGLALGKRAYLVVASGGVYSQGPAAAHDHAVPHLKSVLGLMGITDVEVIRAEGIALGPESEQAALARAREQVASHALAA